MTIESTIFKKFIPDFKKLKKYGFKQKNGKYCFEKIFKNGEFKANIEINQKGVIKGTVYDLENDGEYLPLRIDGQKGKYVQAVRKAYAEMLIDIRNNCFEQNYFISHQANRIADYIQTQYDAAPEFLWKKFPGYAVYRNPDTKKWFAIVMNIDFHLLASNENCEIEIINVKLDEAKVQYLLKKNGFYPAYHMNKKNWITIVLNEKLDDDTIKDYINESCRQVSK